MQMSVIQRFNIAVSTLTVSVMFVMIQYLIPMIQAAGLPTAVLQYVPFLTPVQIAYLSKLLIAGLATGGT